MEQILCNKLVLNQPKPQEIVEKEKLEWIDWSKVKRIREYTPTSMKKETNKFWFTGFWLSFIIKPVEYVKKWFNENGENILTILWLVLFTIGKILADLISVILSGILWTAEHIIKPLLKIAFYVFGGFIIWACWEMGKK